MLYQNKYKPPKNLSKSEQKDLLKLIEPYDLKAQIIPIFILETGLRVSEALSVTLGDIRTALLKKAPSFKVKSLKKSGKRAEYREVFIKRTKIHSEFNYSVYTKLKEYLKLREHEPDKNPLILAPFYKHGIRSPSRMCIGKYLKKLFTEIGIPDRSTHALRHTFAYNRLEEGVTLPVLQILMGHDSLQATSVYVMPRQQDISRAMGWG